MTNKIVLIIEDDEALREIYSIFLELDGYKVFSVEHGKAALELLQSLPPELFPECITLDLTMPVMNGNDFLKTIKNDFRLSEIPIIVCSGFGNYEDSPQVVEIINKPIKLEHLRNSIERCSERVHSF